MAGTHADARSLICPAPQATAGAFRAVPAVGGAWSGRAGTLHGCLAPCCRLLPRPARPFPGRRTCQITPSRPAVVTQARKVTPSFPGPHRVTARRPPASTSHPSATSPLASVVVARASLFPPSQLYSSRFLEQPGLRRTSLPDEESSFSRALATPSSLAL
ncbi:hypothetical protein CDD83_6905 [Cordyceps sp. RAO-2017]|nr:hypothetical protein CDD83_6905 [Cordyceps sp. RAO-2017]